MKTGVGFIERLFAGLVLTLLAAPAGAQAACFPREDVMQALERKHGETLRLSAYVDSLGVMVEVYLSEDGGTWTIVRTLPDGTSCSFLSGSSFEVVPIGDPV